MTTWLLLLVASHHQPFSEARRVSCDLLLEILESKLDEGLSTLDENKSRLARKTIAVRKKYGTIKKFVEEEMKTRLPIGADQGDIL